MRGLNEGVNATTKNIQIPNYQGGPEDNNDTAFDVTRN